MSTARRTLGELLFCLVAASVGAAHIPLVPENVTEFQGRVALLLNTQWFDPLLEVQGRIEGEDNLFRYRSLTVGTYVRPLPNIKLGVFYRLQAGARHDDDWISPTAGAWEWRDTTDRLEHTLIADLSPRFLLPFLPGRDWVFMLKARYELSSHDLQQALLLRPSLTWFLMIDREPLLSLSWAYGLYFPINFGTTTVYQHGPYFELLYHLGQYLKLEVTGSWKTTVWSPSAQLLSSGEEVPVGTFPLRYQAIVIGVGVLVSLTG
jgi:hypothetical protein